MFSESDRLQLIAVEPKFVEKLQRLEALSIQLWLTYEYSDFALQKTSKYPEGRWLLHVEQHYYDGGDELTYVTLRKRIIHWWFIRKWYTVMSYKRTYMAATRKEDRHLFNFEDPVVAELDALSDELEAQVTDIH